MLNLTQEQLDAAIKSHGEWVEDKNRGRRLELENVSLAGLEIKKACLINSSFVNVDFKDADISVVNFEGVFMKDVNFSGMKDLTFVNMSKSELIDVNFSGVPLFTLDFMKSILKGVDFSNSEVSCVFFDDSDLSDSIFSNAKISSCSMNRAKMGNVKFLNCKIQNAKLKEIKDINYKSVSNSGTFKGDIVYLVDSDLVIAGCWSGSLEEFKNESSKIEEDKKNKFNLHNTVEIFSA